MGSISKVNVWPTKNNNGSNLKAFGSFIYDDALSVKFSLVQGAKGLFISFPGKFGDKVDEKTGKKIFYADVTCLDKDLYARLTQIIIQKYSEVTSMNQTKNTDNDNISQVPAQAQKKRILF